MIIVTILGAGIENIILAVALTVWARFARMIRGDVQNSRAVHANDNLAAHIPQHD